MLDTFGKALLHNQLGKADIPLRNQSYRVDILFHNCAGNRNPCKLGKVDIFGRFGKDLSHKPCRTDTWSHKLAGNIGRDPFGKLFGNLGRKQRMDSGLCSGSSPRRSPDTIFDNQIGKSPPNKSCKFDKLPDNSTGMC